MAGDKRSGGGGQEDGLLARVVLVAESIKTCGREVVAQQAARERDVAGYNAVSCCGRDRARRLALPTPSSARPILNLIALCTGALNTWSDGLPSRRADLDELYTWLTYSVRSGWEMPAQMPPRYGSQ